MVTEDYVSFEVAKLLKRKGFNESCFTYYDYIDNSINRFDKGLHFNNTSYPWGVSYGISKAKKYVVAPTLQMACKWLREVHNKHCDIGYDIDLGWFFQIVDLKETVEYYYPEPKYYHAENETGFKTYEETVEAAIKYTLENLI